ncbi:hypothetical protein [Treponema endosymbiont of Eucomonympha sp.]|uniref:hypothetical protein n=1 Tax=Treponema endosymbiont of Eucomonympha sp. TaxID=1580831 RepID=UPI000A67C058|nr:hypothetical protein [Treponema endosymbiont of Eucomonympha sp.]
MKKILVVLLIALIGGGVLLCKHDTLKANAPAATQDGEYRQEYFNEPISVLLADKE